MDVNKVYSSPEKFETQKKKVIFSWFSKQQSEDEISQKRLVLMWALMFVGYFMFCLQWYSISNFSSGWGAAFFEDGKQSTLVGSVPNWMITFGRSIGSILAGFFIAKFGHKYAVVFCLSLMVISFPYIIVAQNATWNSLSIAGGASTVHDGQFATAAGGFSLFVIFRIFLAVGGTTLITYTNSVIAKMPAEKKSKFISLNSFGFNGGAFFGSIFFVDSAIRADVAKPVVWTSILSIFIVLIFIILIAYVIFGVEVVPKKIRETKTFSEKNEVTFKNVLKKKENYVLYYMYFIWLVGVVYINGSGFRSFIEQSPANAQALVDYNIAHSLTGSSIVTAVSKTQAYGWVWPAYICVFVAGYIVSAFTITKFNLTFFRRKEYAATIFTLGISIALIGLIIIYFGGYANSGALAAFLILTFISGIFLWGAQPIFLFIPQQQEGTSPKYVGIVAGLVWGFGYLGYTAADASLSSIATYVGNTSAFSDAVKAAVQSSNHQISGYTSVSSGLIIMFVLFWVLMVSGIVSIFFLPETGAMKDGKFVKFTQVWNPFKLSNYNFYSPNNRF